MASYFDVHPEDPQPRSLNKTVEALRDDAVIAFPTDSGFALGTRLGNHAGLERIREIRKLDAKHNFTLLVSNFAQLGQYVDMDNRVFRAVKAVTPGPFTFILHATREIPRQMQHAKKKTIGVRVPPHVTTLALLDALGEPLVSSTLILPDQAEPMTDGWQVKESLDHQLDIVLDSGDAGQTATTVIDFTVDPVEVVRLGGGDPSLILDDWQ